MVKTISSKRDKREFKKHFDNMISRFGGTFTITRDDLTTDSLGNITTTSTTTFSDIPGEFQRILDNEELKTLGLSGNGNAKFYVSSDYTFYPGDIITVQGIKWKFRNKIEDDEYGYDTNHLNSIGTTWLLVRLDG